jgi:hypothetical protein
MQRRRLLATSLLSTACVLPATAQSATASLTLGTLSTTNPMVNAQSLSTPLKKQNEPLLAQTHSPCYTLRVYGFTPPDLKSPHPHASTETDCTPASSSHLKALQLPATVNAK